jgi:hypothetical protein
MAELRVGLTSDESSEHPYTPADVSRYHVQPRNRSSSHGYQPIFNIGEIVQFNPSFELPPSVTATPALLLELFLPDHLFDEWVECTNEYAASKENETEEDVYSLRRPSLSYTF